MEKIISIAEYQDNNYDGFLIKTDIQEIKLLIGNGQSCCESWGYFMSHNDITEFIGAEISDISIVDELLNVTQLSEINDDECSTMFVNIMTSMGLLQFVAYNSHNGYYGHTAKVISNQLTALETL